MKAVLVVLALLTLAVLGSVGFVVLSHDAANLRPTAYVGSDARVETLTHGARIDIAGHLKADELTLVEFYADW